MGNNHLHVKDHYSRMKDTKCCQLRNNLMITRCLSCPVYSKKKSSKTEPDFFLHFAEKTIFSQKLQANCKKCEVRVNLVQFVE